MPGLVEPITDRIYCAAPFTGHNGKDVQRVYVRGTGQRRAGDTQSMYLCLGCRGGAELLQVELRPERRAR